jgi:hypothetical protein
MAAVAHTTAKKTRTHLSIATSPLHDEEVGVAGELAMYRQS